MNTKGAKATTVTNEKKTLKLLSSQMKFTLSKSSFSGYVTRATILAFKMAHLSLAGLPR